MKDGTLKRFVFGSDFHFPNHDPQALQIMADFCHDFKPHYRIFGGDYLDADSVNPHARAEPHYDQTEEYELGASFMDILKPTHFIMGNHEQRLSRPGLVDASLWTVLDPVNWLQLRRRKIQVFPYSSRKEDIFRLGHLSFVHGFTASTNAAKVEAESFGCVMFGHTHRIQTFQLRQSGNVCEGFNAGCLSRLDPDYITTCRPRGWCQGMGFGYVHRNGNFSAYLVRMVGQEVVINDRRYRRH